jgi:hypothetical protein
LSIAETLLIFAGIPVAVVAIVYALVYGASGRRGSKRYRPGRPFTFAPVWFVAAGSNGIGSHHGAHAVTAGPQRPALPAAEADTPGDEPVTVQYGETGGASDRW